MLTSNGHPAADSNAGPRGRGAHAGCDGGEEPTLQQWNAAVGWRASYAGLADGLLFFAEDALGGRFARRDEQVVTFDPETGPAEPMASGIKEWAQQVLAAVRRPAGWRRAKVNHRIVA